MKKIRKTLVSDLENVLDIYAYARREMIKSGNPDQWGSDRPSKEEIISDIEDGSSYVLEDEDGISGVFTFVTKEVEVYRDIEGAWLNDEPYGAIFRTARNQRGKGMMPLVFAYCEQFTDNLRINTYKDNAPMLCVLKRNGFVYCGKIKKDGGERLAYMRVKENRS